MNRSCTNCGTSFEITNDDLAFYEKVSPVFGGRKYSIPPPKHCPTCRQQLRLSHHNDRHLYRRKESDTGREIISYFSPEKPFTVYEPEKWWGDDWDAISFGKDFDPAIPLFDQLSDLIIKTPVMSLVIDGNEGCAFVNQCGWDKRCYLCFCADHSEDCLYCHSTYYCKDIVDCYYSFNLEKCFKCVHCRECYNLLFSQDCFNCADSAFLSDCVACNKCFGCVGLRHKNHCIFNKQLSEAEYDQKRTEFDLGKYATIQRVLEETITLKDKHTHRFYHGQNNHNSTGNYISNCKNSQHCFDCTDTEDCKYCNSMRGAKDCYDVSHWGHPAELCYYCTAVGEGNTHSLFSCNCWDGCSNLIYCRDCISCNDCFACVALRKKQYCILNKQYTKEEYEKLVSKIIEKRQAEGDWGEFLPKRLSQFAYNETMAQDYFPLSKEEAEKRSWKWRDEKDEIPKVDKIIPGGRLPDLIDDIPDDILNWAVKCEATGRPFRIVKQELEFYRRMRLPVPHLHPDERHRRRMALRNPRKLWKRRCDKCGREMETTYSPERPERVYCETCYLKEVY